jgi:fructose-1,6-bisphosphatase/inositol monophosphatase family enzyme
MLLGVAEEAARAGAGVVRSAHANRTETKGAPGDYVTDVDRRSEGAIVQVLNAEAGDIPVTASP